ncbi:Disulfide-bond oxidoreductase YfcG [compost metagenome]|uniref:Putative glutathione S-transferase (GstA/gst-like) n=2 Tax=Rhizobium/Agrobacterium group TaxID=227290 RepID=A0A1S7S4G9_9HYPH|nr:putative glutathione S-transferase (gstA/gst-like) [Agrobacterium deltaense RV3]CUX62243.1 putative glutathione S-transferase (gstA/gst-like) [Agrobacterium deltaense Zutra 3/1]
MELYYEKMDAATFLPSPDDGVRISREPAMKLYHFPLSGHAHRARLFLSLLNVKAEIVDVDLAHGEHKTPEFLKLNPFGQVPVLEDGDVVVNDSNAILVYVATKFGRKDWLPDDLASTAKIQKWLSVAAGEIAYGPCAARLVTVFGADFRAEEVIARAHRVLALINAELDDHPFMTGETPTIADVALYSYIAGAPEGNVDLAAHPHVLQWLARIEALPGFVPFPKTPVGLAA